VSIVANRAIVRTVEKKRSAGRRAPAIRPTGKRRTSVWAITPRARFRNERNRLREKTNVRNTMQTDLAARAAAAKYFTSPSRLTKEGRIAIVTRREAGLRWTRWRRARIFCADERRRSGRRNRVVLVPRRWHQVVW
jgi:hypothetical protein